MTEDANWERSDETLADIRSWSSRLPRRGPARCRGRGAERQECCRPGRWRPAMKAMHPASPAAKPGGKSDHRMAHGAMITVGDVDYERNGFDPTAMLTDWDTGTVSTLPDGRKLAHLRGHRRGQGDRDRAGRHVPGLDLQRPRARAGAARDRRRPAPDRLQEQSARTRTRCISTASMRRAWTACRALACIDPGEEFVYEFDAKPFGCHLYHCHALPLARHIHKGMYGLFVIDPDPARHPEHAEVARSRLLGTPENARVAGNGDGDERLRHELRRRERVLRLQHHRPLLCEEADQGRSRPAGADLSRQRHGIRPDQLLPSARAISSTISTRARR